MIWLGRALRALAVIIAVLGVVDPVFTWPRSDRPVVALIDADAPALATEVSRELSDRFEIHRGPMAAAAATVITGRALPATPIARSGTLIAVTPAPVSPRVDIEHVTAPATALPASRVPVTVSLHVVGAKARTLRIELSADRDAGSVLLDRATHSVLLDDERFTLVVSAPALGTGVTRFIVRVRDDANAASPLITEAAVSTEAVATRWKVLVVDPRPSWASTFVRRVLEDDRRFDVASRVSTSRNLSVESGGAPDLSNAAALEAFAAVVVGAPDALTTAEVRALDAFARGRGGAVILLMDRVDAGPFAEISGAASFRDVHGVERRKVVGDAGTMIATELAVPASLSSGVTVLASMAGAAAAATSPVVWQAPLGAGRVIVSGALDAWRYRVREANGFAKFWSDAVGAAAAAAPPAVMALPSQPIAAPGATQDVRVVVRRIQLSDPSRPAPLVDVRARLEPVGVTDAARKETLRLWPTAERGVFVAPMRAPDTPGPYRVAVDALDVTGAVIGSQSVEIKVGEVSSQSNEAELSAWTAAHGGVVMSGAQMADVGSAVRARVSANVLSPTVHPMRSFWWLPVFVVALGGEWWLRRRRGER